jgi:hypothetical protein
MYLSLMCERWGLSRQRRGDLEVECPSLSTRPPASKRFPLAALNRIACIDLLPPRESCGFEIIGILDRR